MLIKILDGEGYLQTVIMPGQETVTDRSGSIAVAATWQTVMDTNAGRSGWTFQNVGQLDAQGVPQFNPMWLNEAGVENPTQANSILVLGGQLVSSREYALITGQIVVYGSLGDTFMAREW